MNARTKVRDVGISLRSLVTANIEKCARYARGLATIAVSKVCHSTAAVITFNYF